MSEATYRIRPLEWTDDNIRCRSSARCLFGELVVKYFTEKWHLIIHEGEGTDYEDCDSLEAGKQRAEQFYRERLLTALEEVKRPNPGREVI